MIYKSYKNVSINKIINCLVKIEFKMEILVSKRLKTFMNINRKQLNTLLNIRKFTSFEDFVNVTVTGFLTNTEIIDSLRVSEKENSDTKDFIEKCISGNEIKFCCYAYS